MSKSEFPFLNVDVKKMLGDFKIPSLDIDSLVGASRKNIEALGEANKIAFEGYQAVVKRQADILRETMSEAAGMLRGGTVSDVGKAPELLKQALEAALANMRELAEMTSKANTEAFEVISRRLTENLDELRGSVKAAKDKTKS